MENKIASINVRPYRSPIVINVKKPDLTKETQFKMFELPHEVRFKKSLRKYPPAKGNKWKMKSVAFSKECITPTFDLYNVTHSGGSEASQASKEKNCSRSKKFKRFKKLKPKNETKAKLKPTNECQARISRVHFLRSKLSESTKCKEQVEMRKASLNSSPKNMHDSLSRKSSPMHELSVGVLKTKCSSLINDGIDQSLNDVVKENLEDVKENKSNVFLNNCTKENVSHSDDTVNKNVTDTQEENLEWNLNQKKQAVKVEQLHLNRKTKRKVKIRSSKNKRRIKMIVEQECGETKVVKELLLVKFLLPSNRLDKHSRESTLRSVKTIDTEDFASSDIAHDMKCQNIDPKYNMNLYNSNFTKLPFKRKNRTIYCNQSQVNCSVPQLDCISNIDLSYSTDLISELRSTIAFAEGATSSYKQGVEIEHNENFLGSEVYDVDKNILPQMHLQNDTLCENVPVISNNINANIEEEVNYENFVQTSVPDDNSNAIKQKKISIMLRVHEGTKSSSILPSENNNINAFQNVRENSEAGNNEIMIETVKDSQNKHPIIASIKSDHCEKEKKSSLKCNKIVNFHIKNEHVVSESKLNHSDINNTELSCKIKQRSISKFSADPSQKFVELSSKKTHVYASHNLKLEEIFGQTNSNHSNKTALNKLKSGNDDNDNNYNCQTVSKQHTGFIKIQNARAMKINEVHEEFTKLHTIVNEIEGNFDTLVTNNNDIHSKESNIKIAIHGHSNCEDKDSKNKETPNKICETPAKDYTQKDNVTEKKEEKHIEHPFLEEKATFRKIGESLKEFTYKRNNLYVNKKIELKDKFLETECPDQSINKPRRVCRYLRNYTKYVVRDVTTEPNLLS